MKIIQSNVRSTLSHKLFNLENLQVGEVLVFDIFIKRGQNYFIVIEKGTRLTAELYAKLQKQNKLYIRQEDVKKEKLTCESLKDYLEVNKNELEASLKLLYSINEKIFDNFLNSRKDQIDLHCVRTLITSVVKLLKEDNKYLKNVISRFADIHELDKHSLHVAIYSISIGISLRMDINKLVTLGMTGLLHDLGLKKINQAILQKKDKLSHQELALVHKHPEFSVEILKHNGVSDPYIISGVGHHHENKNGTGYPYKISGENISEFGTIIAIADVFDALTNRRPHREAYSSFQALSIMMKENSMAERFNFSYLESFLRLLKK